MIRSTEHPSSP